MNEVIVVERSLVDLSALPVKWHACGAVFSESITEQQFKEIWKLLRRCAKSLQWRIGDAINFATERSDAGYVRPWGLRYAKALTDTDLEYGTLRNYAWVCEQVDLSRRRDNLSFAHHQEVASLKAAEQSKWLDKAIEEGWSKSELRCAIRKSQRTRGLSDNVPAGFVLKPRVAEIMRWLEIQDMDEDGRRAAIKRDLRPLGEYYNSL